jgi:hypothetical protein
MKNLYLILIFLLVSLMLATGCTEKSKSFCNGVEYNPYMEQVCCRGTLFTYQNGFSCCGETYSNNSDCCYNGSYEDKKKGLVGELYDESTQHCFRGILMQGSQKFWGVCGGLEFKRDTHHCCNDVIMPGADSEGNWYDCGNTCYNLDNQSCCQGQVYTGVDRCCYEKSDLICSERMRCCDKMIGAGHYEQECYDPDNHGIMICRS